MRYGRTLLGAAPQDLADLVEAQVSPNEGRHLTPPGWAEYAARLPQPPYHWLPVRPGTFRWPVGAARWAHAYFLADDDQLLQIQREVYARTYDPLTLLISDGAHQVQAPMYLLPPRPLSQWVRANGLWLLTLVDDRYFWWERSGEASATAGSTTWSGLIGQIATLLGVTVEVDAIDAAHLAPPASLANRQTPLPPLLDLACQCVGHRLVRSLDGAVMTQSARTALASQQRQAAKWPRFKGGEYNFTR